MSGELSFQVTTADELLAAGVWLTRERVHELIEESASRHRVEVGRLEVTEPGDMCRRYVPAVDAGEIERLRALERERREREAKRGRRELIDGCAREAVEAFGPVKASSSLPAAVPGVRLSIELAKRADAPSNVGEVSRADVLRGCVEFATDAHAGGWDVRLMASDGGWMRFDPARIKGFESAVWEAMEMPEKQGKKREKPGT